jgi:transitional endoplasmic reticulum ATPase
MKPPQWRPSRVRPIAAGGALLALDCAQNIHAAVGCRTPEAAALATWLIQQASAFGLSGDFAEEANIGSGRFGGGVCLADWRKLGATLTKAAAFQPGVANTVAARWTQEVGSRLGFDSLEIRIFALALNYRLDQRVERLFDAISDCRGGANEFHRNANLIGLLLKLSPAAVATSLAGDARLLSSGLLHLGGEGQIFVAERLLALIRRDEAPRTDLYDQLLGTIAAEPLPWECFAHLGREAEVAASVLEAALAGRDKGVNILLYGPPGTGKTAFAATLAARAGVRLRPVAETDDDGGEPSRNERLAALRLAHRLAVPGQALLLFDEAEDLFGHRTPFGPTVSSSRVFIHRLLERVPVPTIWTANDIDVLGPAVVRRMTMCLELRVPNLATRTRLWRSMGETEGVLLTEADAARLARLVPAAPAVASAALRATRLAGGCAETARLIVEGVARAVGGGGLPAPEREQDTCYDPGLVNADCDLAALTTGLLREGASRAVSFLVSGPPGVGKSAWVRHVAGLMGMPVLQKRASDLLNPFLGGTEQNIAGAFAEARDAQAFLVFDEADSLLLERADAVRSWEISQVNEMLTWMESHALPFACTTNLADRLDRASLRRFLVKLRFDWLTAAQARRAFRSFFGLPAPVALEGLRTLTPADFALVRRRAAVHGGEADAAGLVGLLAAECEGRTGGRLQVGFASRAKGDCDAG